MRTSLWCAQQIILNSNTTDNNKLLISPTIINQDINELTSSLSQTSLQNDSTIKSYLKAIVDDDHNI